MQPITTSKNLVAIKKYISGPKKLQQNLYQQVEDGNEEDKRKDANNTSYIM